MVCDFVAMLGVTETELENMIHVVKEVCQKESDLYKYKTERIQQLFRPLVNDDNITLSMKQFYLEYAAIKSELLF